MKNHLILIFLLIAISSLSQTVGINSTGAVPATSAMLDIFATDKGLLIPRVDIIDLNTSAPVSSPTTSLLVYNTNVTSGVGYYFWNGSKWINLKDSNSNSDEDWYEAGTTTSPDDITDDIFTKGKVGIGLTNPIAFLDVSPGGLNGTVNPLRTVINSVVTPGSSNGYNLYYGSGGTTLNAGVVYGLHLDFTSGGTTYGVYSEGEKYNYFSGSLGVGVNTPSELVHVYSDREARLLIEGDQDGYINAGVVLKANQGTNDRGTGVFFYDTGAQNEWYAGRPYRLTDRFVIQRKSGLASHGDVTAGLVDGSGTVTGTERFFTIMNDGKTGVGTITPTEKLDVLGNVQMRSYSLGIANGLFFRAGFNSTSNPYNLSITTDSFDGNGTPDALSINGYEGVSISTGHNTSLQRRLTINNVGDVGIGTVSPSADLELEGSGSESSFHIDASSISGTPLIRLQKQGVSKWGWLGEYPNPGMMSFFSYDLNQFVMVALNNGNVGIGTVAPNAPLEISPVNISAIQEGIRLIDGGSGSSEGLWLQFGQAAIDDYARFGGRSYNNTSGALYFSTKDNADASPVERMRVAPNGNVGIGTIAPSYQFQVSTNSAAKPTSNTWTVASDRRLKTNIRSYEGGLDDLLKIDPVWFTYTGKAGMPKDTGVGIIAQDLQKVAPYMVNEWTYDNEGEEEKYLGVDNGAMTYMLINAVKELKAENDLLKKELREIKELLKNLK